MRKETGNGRRMRFLKGKEGKKEGKREQGVRIQRRQEGEITVT